MGLMRAVPPQDGGNGLGDDQQIAERRPGVDVVVVELHPVLEVTSLRPLICHRHVTPCGTLRRRRAKRVVVLDLARQRRPRADQRHFAEQHVDEIRQLVDARAPQEPAAGDAAADRCES